MSNSKIKNPLAIDFEFSRIVEPVLGLVCCATYDLVTKEKKKYWLHKDKKAQSSLAKTLSQYENFVAYSAIAEQRSFITLGLDPLKFKWVDLFLEYRCITNHNDNLQWGEQLVNGKVKTVRKPKPKWQKIDGEDDGSFKATHSLAEATYKLTGEIRDTKHKNEMRELIISYPEQFTPEEREAIMEYCLEDVIFLPRIKERIWEEYFDLDSNLTESLLQEEAEWRGRYAAHTAIMENNGYPIDVEKTKNFSKQVGNILYDCQKEINELFPDIKPFRWNKPEQKFSWDQKKTREWVKKYVGFEEKANAKGKLIQTFEKTWMMTDGGKKNIPDLSLSLEAWQRYFDYKHDYPKDNFGAQMVRYLKLKQTLYGFVPSAGKDKKTFWSFVGSDGRARPYTNIYGAQSSRSQPSSTGFMFLKPAWMRALVVPPKGKALAGIDYASQEFLISAIESKDQNMIDSYLSGDVYLAFYKLAGLIPEWGTKETHGSLRNDAKAAVLGMSYLMSKYGLAIKMTQDSGREWTQEEAEAQIELFYDTYPDLAEYQQMVQDVYKDDCYIKLECVGGDTPVMTDNGVKDIKDVLLEDLIWDGVEFVKHGGILHRGEKSVIHLKEININATPNHLFLRKNMWLTALEFEESESRTQRMGRFLEDGRLLVPEQKLGKIELSSAAAYVALKKRLESHCYMTDWLKPVLTALNLCVPEDLSQVDIPIFLMTSILQENGKLVSSTPGLAAKIRIIPNSKTMVLEAFNSSSTPLESSWNVLLHCLAMTNGMALLTELIITEVMSLETFELLARQSTTKIDVYDILNCGPRNQYQTGDIISHNCGWYMWGDNENHRSVCNVPIQGLGASIMRKAVDLAVEKGCQIAFTLHDAIYIEYDLGDEYKIKLLADSMREAFAFYFPENLKEYARMIRLDPFAWSPAYADERILDLDGFKVETSELHIDPRAKTDYDAFSKYFNENSGDLL